MAKANRELAGDADRLIQELWPGAQCDASGVYRVGGLDQVEGTSAAVFTQGAEGPRFFDHNGDLNMDLIDVWAHRNGKTAKEAVKELRKAGRLSGADPGTRVRSSAVKPAETRKAPGGLAVCTNFYIGRAGSTLSLLDLDEQALWVPADPETKNCLGNFRYSTRGELGVRLARYGGPYTDPKGRSMVLKPWMTRDETLRLIESTPWLRDRGAIPIFCLSGSPDCLCPRDPLVIDVDVESARAEVLRDRFMAPMIELGAAVFASTSGRGRHVLARVAEVDVGALHYRALPPEGKRDGFRVEIFPAGTKRQVVLRRDRQLSGGGLDDPLPRLELASVDAAARRAFAGAVTITVEVDLKEVGTSPVAQAPQAPDAVKEDEAPETQVPTIEAVDQEATDEPEVIAVDWLPLEEGQAAPDLDFSRKRGGAPLCEVCWRKGSPAKLIEGRFLCADHEDEPLPIRERDKAY